MDINTVWYPQYKFLLPVAEPGLTFFGFGICPETVNASCPIIVDRSTLINSAVIDGEIVSWRLLRSDNK